MRPIFADTSYFIALVISGDEHHEAAAAWARSSQQPLCTTEYVLIETGNFLSPIGWRRRFVDLYERLEADSDSLVISASHSLLRRGVDLYASRSDHAWSLVDCISFVVMRDEGLTDALTFDKHFEQAGFASILK